MRNNRHCFGWAQRLCPGLTLTRLSPVSRFVAGIVAVTGMLVMALSPFAPLAAQDNTQNTGATIRAATSPGEFAKEQLRNSRVDDDFQRFVERGYVFTFRPSRVIYTVVEVDLPAIDGSTQEKRFRLLFTRHADLVGDRPEGDFDLVFTSRFVIVRGTCGAAVDSTTGQVRNGRVGTASFRDDSPELTYSINADCPAQKIEISIEIPDLPMSGDGRFYVRLAGLEDEDQVVILQAPARVSEDYAFTSIADYRIEASQQAGTGGNVLATISGGDFAVDDTKLLVSGGFNFRSVSNLTTEDAKLLLLIDSDSETFLENFVTSSNREAAHKLRIRSNIAGTVPARFFRWPQSGGLYALVERSARSGEVFTIYTERADNTGSVLVPYQGLEENPVLNIRAYGYLLRISKTNEMFIYPAQGRPDPIDYADNGDLRPVSLEERYEALERLSYTHTQVMQLPVMLPPFAPGVARFVMPWVYEGDALAAQGEQMVTTSLRLSNLTNKTIGPVWVEVADSSVVGISVDARVILFEMVAPYTSVEVTGEMLTDALPDFGQATLVLTVDGASPQDLTLRRFTDVGGDLYTDSFGTADSFNEFNPTP